MNLPEPPEMDSDGDRQSDLAVMDAEEYKNKRRLKGILDAHDRVEDWADQALAEYISGEFSLEAYNIVVYEAVCEFIRECYNMLTEHHREADGETDGYWRRSSPIGSLSFEHREDVVFNGLADFLNAERIYTEEWTEPVRARHGPNSTEEHSETHTVPEEVSMQAFMLLKQFLEQEYQLDLTFEPAGDALPTARQFDQSRNGQQSELERVEMDGTPDL